MDTRTRDLRTTMRNRMERIMANQGRGLVPIFSLIEITLITAATDQYSKGTV